ncbi:MAG: hypothetical protein V4515_14305 [Chloroflexota bacterium]
MEIVRRETLTPMQANMLWLALTEEVVLLYGLRCRRGCIGTFRQLVPLEVLNNSAFLAELEGIVLEWAGMHACLRKAVVGDWHRCALCGWPGVVDRCGEMPAHSRVYGPNRLFWGGGPVEVEACRGSVGRRIGA